MKRPERSLILVLGDCPFDNVSFEQRRLTIRKIEIEQLDDSELTNSARGVLLTPFPGKFRLVSSYFEERFHRACELGLMTAVRVANKTVQVSVMRNAAYERAKLFEDIVDPNKRQQCFEQLPWVYLDEEVWAIAEALARYNPGPPLGRPEIVVNDQTTRLDPETKTLLKRAFHDTYRITVCPLTGGRTAKGTFSVFANLDNGQYGPQPIPFFVKLASSQMIKHETFNYHEFVEPFIPFHLHPSLNVSAAE